MTVALYKVVVVGSSGVGKTAMVQRLVDGVFVGDGQPTIGVEFKCFECQAGPETVKLNICDTAGQERFRSVSRAYFRNAVGAVLVYSLTDRGSFDELDGWLNDINTLCSANASVVVVGNKADLRDDRAVADSEAKAFARRHAIATYIERSALEATNIAEVFVRLATSIHAKVLNNDIRGSFMAATPPVLVRGPAQGGCC
jgi:small GTP-binding protein